MDVSLHDGVLAIHLAGVLAWLGVVLVMDLLGSRVRAREDAEAAVAFAVDYGWVTRTVALPAAIALLLSGGWLMQDSNLRLREQWWLGTGIGVWAVAFLGSTMLRGGECARIGRQAAELGAHDEDVRWRIRRVLLIARGELLLLTVAFVVMTLQPG